MWHVSEYIARCLLQQQIYQTNTYQIDEISPDMMLGLVRNNIWKKKYTKVAFGFAIYLHSTGYETNRDESMIFRPDEKSRH